jgi:hypothetical protein
MALKDTVKTLEEVDEAHRPLYVADKELGFKLDVEGREDPAELRRAKTRETEGRKAAEAKLAEYAQKESEREEELRKSREDAAKKAGNVDELQKSWQEKYDKDLAAETARTKPLIDSLNSDVVRITIDREATEMAAQLAIPDSAEALYPHIRGRLAVEMRDGQRTTVVRDKDGKASALTLDDLKKEILATKAFQPLLVANRASGGGANGGKGGGATDSKSIPRAAFDALSQVQRMAFIKSGGVPFDPT